MFGKGMLSGWRLQIISAFVTGIMMSSSMLYGASPQVVINEIKKEIRQDGLSMSYNASETFDESEYLKKIFSGFDQPSLKKTMKIVDIISKLTKDMGMNDLDGYGSSVAKQGVLYDSDSFIHLKRGNEKSVLWQILGGKAQKLTTFDLLPASTILSTTFRIDPVVLWKFIKKSVNQIKIPGITDDLEARLAEVEQMAASQGFPIESVVKALRTEASLVVTMNKNQMMKLPDMPPIPQLGVTLIMKKQDMFIQNFVLMALGQAPTIKSTIGEFQVLTLNQQLPTGTKAGVAYSEHEFIISSDISVVKQIVQAKAGKGLVSSKKFQKYSSISRTGNGAFYVSQDISNQISEQLKTLPQEISFGIKSYSIAFFQDKIPGLFGVYGKKSNGIKVDMLSTFNIPSGTNSTLVGVAVIGILAAMVLPALATAREKAKMANSKSNLKNMGTSVAAFFADGVSTNFPKDYKKMQFDRMIFSHPLDSKPVDLDEVFKGNRSYVPVYKAGAAYEGSSTKPLFMERPGFWKTTNLVYVVFEDGHVEGFRGATVEAVLKDIKNKTK